MIKNEETTVGITVSQIQIILINLLEPVCALTRMPGKIALLQHDFHHWMGRQRAIQVVELFTTGGPHGNRQCQVIAF